MLRPPRTYCVTDQELEIFSGLPAKASDLDRLLARELIWRGRSEWEIRAEMEAALTRRNRRHALARNRQLRHAQAKASS